MCIRLIKVKCFKTGEREKKGASYGTDEPGVSDERRWKVPGRLLKTHTLKQSFTQHHGEQTPVLSMSL